MPKPAPKEPGRPQLSTYSASDGVMFMSEIARDGYENARKHLEMVLAAQAQAADIVTSMKPEIRAETMKQMAEFRRPFEEAVIRWMRVSVTMLRITPDGKASWL